MKGLIEIFRKEMADAFTGRRFLIIFPLIMLAGFFSAYVAAQSIKPETNSAGLVSGSIQFVFLRLFTDSSGSFLSFQSMMMYLIPVVAIALGFDAINNEKNSGTMSRLVAQPIYRDAIINGKFLAGWTTIAIMLTSITLIAVGLGLRQFGVAPTSEEAVRIFVFLLSGILYGGFWLALSILFSILLDRTATSALAAFAFWVFFAFFMGMIAQLLGNWISPVLDENDATQLIKNIDTTLMAMRFSPTGLYNEATFMLLDPTQHSLGVMPSWILAWMIDRPLPLGQSLLLILPHLVSLVALTAICFGASYIKFMRTEIRST